MPLKEDINKEPALPPKPRADRGTGRKRPMKDLAKVGDRTTQANLTLDQRQIHQSAQMGASLAVREGEAFVEAYQTTKAQVFEAIAAGIQSQSQSDADVFYGDVVVELDQPNFFEWFGFSNVHQLTGS